jgi:hypothetical protein
MLPCSTGKSHVHGVLQPFATIVLPTYLKRLWDTHLILQALTGLRLRDSVTTAGSLVNKVNPKALLAQGLSSTLILYIYVELNLSADFISDLAEVVLGVGMGFFHL